jgi:hypothetical protein
MPPPPRRHFWIALPRTAKVSVVFGRPKKMHPDQQQLKLVWAESPSAPPPGLSAFIRRGFFIEE